MLLCACTTSPVRLYFRHKEWRYIFLCTRNLGIRFLRRSREKPETNCEPPALARRRLTAPWLETPPAPSLRVPFGYIAYHSEPAKIVTRAHSFEAPFVSYLVSSLLPFKPPLTKEALVSDKRSASTVCISSET